MATDKLLKAFYMVLILTVALGLAYFAGAINNSSSMLFFWFIIFVTSLAVLIKSADYFIDAAEGISLILGISPFIIGVTIVALGTSLPELVTSMIATLKGQTEFVTGNAFGSNVANILLVLGFISLFITKMKVKWDLIKIDLPLLFGTMLLALLTTMDGKLTWVEGIVCMLGGVVYIAYTMSIKREKGGNGQKFKWSLVAILLAAAFGIFLGSKYTVESVIQLSTLLGFANTSVLALSVVAIGTSLPELTVSIKAARKGNHEIAIGNILGSNIFNLTFVIGIPSLVSTLIVPQSTLMVGLTFVLGATLLYIFSSLDKEITQYEGALFFICYILFIATLFGVV